MEAVMKDNKKKKDDPFAKADGSSFLSYSPYDKTTFPAILSDDIYTVNYD